MSASNRKKDREDEARVVVVEYAQTDLVHYKELRNIAREFGATKFRILPVKRRVQCTFYTKQGWLFFHQVLSYKGVTHTVNIERREGEPGG